MIVVYADDEPNARLQVSRALRTKGHTVFTLDTGNPAQLEIQTTRLLKLVQEGLNIDVLIVDGHNYLLDSNGQLLVDMTPLGFLNWLWQNGLAKDCHYILYTNDQQMVERAKTQTQVKFVATICKVGEEGGLQILLDHLDKLKYQQSLFSAQF
jgi:CheY-like chemotaxis protein